MTNVLTILIAILGFGVLILVHELGHFLMARLMGVRVNEFAIGMGPKLFSFGKGETTYSLRLFPIGGFCAMEGEDEEAPAPQAVGGNAGRGEPAEPVDPARSFNNKKVWQRILITVAGVTMNLILGFVLSVTDLAVFTTPNQNGDRLYGTTTLFDVPETAPSYQTGLRAGDTFLTVNGRPIISELDLPNVLQSDEDGVFDMVVRRNGEKVTLKGVTFEVKKDAETGRQTLIYDFTILGVKPTVWNTITCAAKQECSMAVLVWTSLGDLFSGRYKLNDLSGPIGTVKVTAETMAEGVEAGGWKSGLSSFVFLMMLITVNLGVMNLLPLPALDGGRLLFLIIEGITRRRLPQKVEGIINLVGLALLMLLLLVITGSDILKIFA